MARASAKTKKICFVKENLTETERQFARSHVCKTSLVGYEYEGKDYCVLHFPSADKIEAFDEEIYKRLNSGEQNFDYTYFPNNIDFINPSFEKPLSFKRTTFSGEVRFMSMFEGELDFRWAQFNENSRLIFRYCGIKNGLDLRYATVRGHLQFEGGSFMNSKNGKLEDVLLLVFEGGNSWLDLQNVVIEKPEQVLFHTVRLQPNWFVNVDCRKFTFTDCRWMTPEGKQINVREEVNGVLSANGIVAPTNPHALLTKTCLQLAENYESNKDYEKSSLFWQVANEAKRIAEYKGYKIWSLHWWYWFLSFYGESWRRAALFLLVLIGLFSFGYASIFSRFVNPNKPTITIEQNADEIEEQITELAKEANEYRLMEWTEALFYTLRVGALQRPEPQPESTFAKGLVAIETILVPLQAALLALAIRRKFMR